MRFRPLIVCSIALALLPLSAPAHADPTPLPTPVQAPVQAPDVAPTPPQAPPEEPAQDPVAPEDVTPEDLTPEDVTPEDKVEDGLGVDGGSERAVVELTGTAEHDPVARQAAADSVDVLLQPQDQPFMVVEGTADELAALAEDPRVSSIHRDRTYTPVALGPSLSLIGADRAHARNVTGAGQAVAVLDTGIDPDHPWFQGRILAQACFSAVEDGVESLCPNGLTEQTDGDAADATTERCLSGGVNLCDHGSHVAGIAAGTGGVAPGAGIVAVQVFSRVNDEDVCGEPSCLLAYESSLRQAMDYVTNLQLPQPIAAVNLSLGGMPSDTVCDTSEEGEIFKPKIDALLAKGIATVVAAGNEYTDGASAPACVSTAVAVGANDAQDLVADFSNRGALLDFFAPGVDIESAVPDDSTMVYSGTSMATPHVTGALALMRQAYPGTPTAELVETLKRTGRPYVYDSNGTQVTTPRLDLAAALGDAPVQPPVTQSPALPSEPDVPDAPEPDPYVSGPTPEPDAPADPQPQPQPSVSPVPLPRVTVTVTVTQTPPSASAVCTRATKAKKLTSAKWAVEIHRSSGTIPDATLGCYLKLISKSSKVFPELTKASSLGTAYRVLKNTRTGKARLDSALLTAWLNWAHGVNGTSAMVAAEKVRMSRKPSAATLKKATTKVLKTTK